MASISLLVALDFIRKLPEKDIAVVCNRLKLAENKAFKDILSKHAGSHSPYTDSCVEMFSRPNDGVLSSIYYSVENVLFVGGCAPGVGIAFNIVDACFCIVLNNWIGAFVSIISCFPIPGFKLAGKGLEKFVMSVLVNISPVDMQRFFKLLGNRLMKIGFHSNDCYIKIGNRLEEVVIGLNNPFAAETIKLVASAVRKMCKNNRYSPVEKYAIQTKGITQGGAVQPNSRLLTLTQRAIK